MRYKYTQMPPTRGEVLTKFDGYVQIKEVLQAAEADIIIREELHQGMK